MLGRVTWPEQWPQPPAEQALTAFTEQVRRLQARRSKAARGLRPRRTVEPRVGGTSHPVGGSACRAPDPGQELARRGCSWDTSRNGSRDGPERSEVPS